MSALGEVESGQMLTRWVMTACRYGERVCYWFSCLDGLALLASYVENSYRTYPFWEQWK